MQDGEILVVDAVGIIGLYAIGNVIKSTQEHSAANYAYQASTVACGTKFYL